VKRRVGYLPEDVGFYPDLTGMENLKYIARLNGIPEKDVEARARELLARVGLAEQAEKKTGKYSRGMRQRLGLAEVLIKTPEVIILDEPTSGIDPTGIREFLELIVQLSKEEGITVLFSSHNLHQVQQVCDRVGLFVSGKLIAEGNIESLSQKLFSTESFVVEAGVNSSGKENNGNGLEEILKDIDGVTSVSQKDHTFYVGCSRDATADIAREIVSSGSELAFLRKKEYGLDDIYNRYFEGGEVHE
jgi:ABC-2 type transport system ATP-binding protein